MLQDKMGAGLSYFIFSKKVKHQGIILKSVYWNLLHIGFSL